MDASRAYMAEAVCALFLLMMIASHVTVYPWWLDLGIVFGLFLTAVNITKD